MESAENTKPNHCHGRLGCGRRHIAVHATGEVKCPPDQMQFIISVRSCKGTVDGAQSSVRRRTEYITQVLRNNGIQERCIRCSSEMRREESVSVQTDVVVQSDDLLTCETVRNLLIEKLDPSVQFGTITYHHTAENKDFKRLEANVRYDLLHYTHWKARCVPTHVSRYMSADFTHLKNFIVQPIRDRMVRYPILY